MSAIIRLAKSRPIMFGAGYSLLKTTGCDLMVQKARGSSRYSVRGWPQPHPHPHPISTAEAEAGRSLGQPTAEAEPGAEPWCRRHGPDADRTETDSAWVPLPPKLLIGRGWPQPRAARSRFWKRPPHRQLAEV